MQSRLHHDGTDYRVLKGTQKQGCSDGVDLCTFHSLKGLEYRVIILMGVNERNIPSRVTEGHPFYGMDKVAQKEYLPQSAHCCMSQLHVQDSLFTWLALVSLLDY